MAYDYLKQDIGIFFAAQDLTDWQYKAVQLNSLNGAPMWQKPPQSGSGIVQGILKNAPIAGGECIVQFQGIAKAILGGSSPILAGRPVTIDTADGTIIEGGAFGTTVQGGSPGDIISILLSGGGDFSLDNFNYNVAPESPPLTIPTGQSMIIHDCEWCIEGSVNIDGVVYIEE